eukprot:1467879-Pleurochrysis_carterae.AAC.2
MSTNLFAVSHSPPRPEELLAAAPGANLRVRPLAHGAVGRFRKPFLLAPASCSRRGCPSSEPACFLRRRFAKSGGCCRCSVAAWRCTTRGCFQCSRSSSRSSSRRRRVRARGRGKGEGR